MSVIIVTGSAGLIGSEAARFFHGQGYDVAGVDNDMRAYFFGEQASTAWNRQKLLGDLPRYLHHSFDIRDYSAVDKLFAEYGNNVAGVIHTAAQPSHDWAAREPLTDFGVNATGTLHVLEAARRHCPEAVFIFTSTNKVYGDTPNDLPLVEKEERWEVDPDHPFAAHGIDESMSIDHSKHSLFGASKVAADVLVQEYGRYFGMKTAVFRGGCLTGPSHSAAELHGFLAYLVLCAATRQAVHRLRVQGQAGPRQHPQPRPDRRLLALLPEAPAGRGLQHGRRRGTRTCRCSKRSAWSKNWAAAGSNTNCPTRPAAATTSGTSATSAPSAGTTRSGSTRTRWSRSCGR